MIRAMAKTFRELVEDAGIHPQDLADRLEVHRSAVGFWMTGEKRPIGHRLRRIADVLEVPMDALRDALAESAKRFARSPRGRKVQRKRTR